jgi:hydrogenase maturation protease
MAAAAPALVIGLGNILLRDDGAGIRAVEALRDLAERDQTMPPDARFVDGGTLGMDLLRTVEGARLLLLLDAVDLDLPPGTVTVLRGDAIVAAGGRWGGAAEGGVGELLAVARLMGWLPDPVALVGIQVADMGFGMGLSERVEAALPGAVEAARRELLELDELTATAGHVGLRSDAPGGATA